MPCLSISAVSALKESIRVSNAESQFAVPLIVTTFLASSVTASPKGSAVCTAAGGGVAGVCAAAGGGDGAGAGGGVADEGGLAEGGGTRPPPRVGEAGGARAGEGGA